MKASAGNADAKSRDLILNDFTHTLFVEAGAGSGKTTAMVSRLMKIIINGLADIREVVAITFTNEGAASLKNKVLQELETAAANGAYSPPGGTMEMLSMEQVQNVRDALTYLPLAHLSTIHAFCLGMLKERPVEAGIDPAFDMNTEGNVVWAFEEAWMAFLLECASRNHPFMKLALDYGIPIDQVQAMARRRSENPDLRIWTEPVEDIADAGIERGFKRLRDIVNEMNASIGLIEGDRPSGKKDKRLAFVKELSTRVAGSDTFAKRKGLLTTLEVLRDWSGRLAPFEKWTAELESICHGVRKQHEDHLHHHMALFVEEFAEWFGRYKRSASRLYFDDLLWLTREMLRTNRDVREYFKQRYHFLCIDETQDTDPLQTEIVFFLSEQEGHCADDWRKVLLKPSKLFLVGDPKQSIYKFRRADIATYEEAKELIATQGGKVIHLDRNFRSAPPIIEFVNRHFQLAFEGYAAERALRLQPAYVPLVAAAPLPSRLNKHIFAIQTPDTGKAPTPAEFTRLECEKIISFIRHIVGPDGLRIADARDGTSRPVRYSDIMLLMKNMTQVAAYERHLEDADIPHFQVGGKTFFQTEDIRGFAFALLAIDDPTNTVALFGALRSPVFGFSDKGLFEFVSGGKRLHLFAGKEGEPDRVSQALLILKQLHYRREWLRPSGVLKEIFNVSGLCHAVMSERNGVQKSARYFRLLELVYELEADRTRSFRTVVDALRAVMELDDPQLASVVLSRGASDAVKITTIHKAKGLEAPVVILAGAKTKPWTKTPDVFVLRDEGKLVIPYGQLGGFYSKDAGVLKRFELQRERCEEERLRYVAATRARDMLVICVPSPEEGLETFTGYFASSLMLNELVETVRVQAPLEPSGQRGQPVDLLEVFTEAVKQRQQRLEHTAHAVSTIASPFVSVHDVMEVDEEVFRQKRVSRGKAYGNVVHRIMQHYVAGPDFDAQGVIDVWMEEEGVPARYRTELLEAFTGLREYPHVKAATTATEKHCEWGFYVTRDGRILAGVIDLVYRSKEGWVILDYKTDDVSDPERKKKLDAMYSQQLIEYAWAFEQITGHQVSERVVAYVDEVVKIAGTKE